MAAVFELLVSWIVINGMTYALIILDERKIVSEQQLERAWTPKYRNWSIVALGPFALIIHFIKTRVSWSPKGVLWGFPKGLLLGVLACVLVLIVGGTLLDIVFTALGFPDSD